MEHVWTQCGMHLFVTVTTVCAWRNLKCQLEKLHTRPAHYNLWLLFLLPGPKACADQNGSASEVHRQYPRERMQDGHWTVRFKWLQYLRPWSPGDIPWRDHVWPHGHTELLSVQPAFCQFHRLAQSRRQTFSIRHGRSAIAPPEVPWAEAEVLLNCDSKFWGWWWLSLVVMCNMVVTRKWWSGLVVADFLQVAGCTVFVMGLWF
jgi:hypothetical protein